MSSPTILVVDDNQDSRTILCAVFRHCGYIVIEALDGEYALQVARDGAVALVISELYVPVGDASCLVEVLKRRAETASIPVLVVTSRVMPDDRQLARDVGCDAVLGKPFDLREIIRVANGLLGATHPAGTPLARDPSPAGTSQERGAWG